MSIASLKELKKIRRQKDPSMLAYRHAMLDAMIELVEYKDEQVRKSEFESLQAFKELIDDNNNPIPLKHELEEIRNNLMEEMACKEYPNAEPYDNQYEGVGFYMTPSKYCNITDNNFYPWFSVDVSPLSGRPHVLQVELGFKEKGGVPIKKIYTYKAIVCPPGNPVADMLIKQITKYRDRHDIQ